MFKNPKIKDYLFIIPIIFILIIKIPHLSLPYFWDEAWSYFTAVQQMYESGPSLLPGALPLKIAKGHPLFFFFIYSSWMHIFGTSVTVVHILSLLISVATIMVTYLMVKKHANQNAALIAIVLLSIQSLFLAQASMVLPEMLLTLLLLLSIHMYLSRNFGWFILSAGLMVMTKETSIVFICGFLLMHLLTYIKPEKEARKYIVETFMISVPLIIYAIFLVLHKIEFGSFFYPDHTGYVDFRFDSVSQKINIATEIIFTRYGRKTVLIISTLSLLIILIKKTKLKSGTLLALILIQTLLFLSFSAINFYTQRYMLGLLSLFMIASAVIMENAKLKNLWLNTLILIFVTSIPLYSTLTQKSNTDKDLGYVEAVMVHQKMVHFCEEQDWQDKGISASFNLIYYLRDYSLGYLSQDKGFSNVSDLRYIRDSEIFLIDCTNHGKELQIDTIKTENQLVKEYQIKQAWGEIYTNLSTK